MEYKGYKIEGDGTFGHKIIKAMKGALPNVLKGSFTNHEFAKKAINAVVDAKEIKDGSSITAD